MKLTILEKDFLRGVLKDRSMLNEIEQFRAKTENDLELITECDKIHLIVDSILKKIN